MTFKTQSGRFGARRGANEPGGEDDEEDDCEDLGDDDDRSGSVLRGVMRRGGLGGPRLSLSPERGHVGQVRPTSAQID